MYKDNVQMASWYKREGDKRFIHYVLDAAGPSGDLISNKINVLGTEPDSDVDGIQMRSVNVKGRLARQDQMPEKKMTTISFFHNKRFMIKITTFDYSTEETWNLVDELDFNALDKLIK